MPSFILHIKVETKDYLRVLRILKEARKPLENDQLYVRASVVNEHKQRIPEVTIMSDINHYIGGLDP